VTGIPYIHPAPVVKGVFVTGRFAQSLSSFPERLGNRPSATYWHSRSILHDAVKYPLLDGQIDEVIRFIGSRTSYEALYLYGSRAEGTATEKSDFDMLLITKTGFYVTHYVRLYKLKRLLKKHFRNRVDLHVASTASLRRSSAGFPLRIIRRNGLLVSGNDVLPESTPFVEPTSYRLTCALACFDFLLHLRLTPDGVNLEKKDLSRSVRFLRQYSDLVGGKKDLSDVASRLEGLEGRQESDAREACRAVADFLDRDLEGLRFSKLDLFLYVPLAWIRRRKRILLGVFFRRRHATERILEAQALLLRAACSLPPDLALLRRTFELLSDHVNDLNTEDSHDAWNKLRTVVATYWLPAVEAVRFTRDSWFY
jgi:predicted nucleotidyltransferase